MFIITKTKHPRIELDNEDVPNCGRNIVELDDGEHGDHEVNPMAKENDDTDIVGFLFK